MSYPLPWTYRTAPRAQAQPAAKPSGAIAVFGEYDPPAGGYAGEFLSAPSEPPRPALRPLLAEAPPWAGLEGDALLAQPEPEPQPARRSAVDEMLAADPDREWPEWAPPAPPLPPLERFVPPEPDWQQEEAERLQRERLERERRARELRVELLQELLSEEIPAAHPPPRREPA